MRFEEDDEDMEIDETGDAPGVDETILDVKIISGKLRED